MTIAPGAMGDTRSVPIMEQSKAKTMLRHPTLGVSFMGALIGDGAVSGYRGIPYGTLKKRWTRASAFSHHPDSIFDARNFGPKCPQNPELNCTKDYGPFIAFPDLLEDDFDCLNLNVYCPTVRAGEPLPVLVWIHGGSLCVGAGSDPIWDPAYFVAESIRFGRPIVAVSINYRLGPFGFLAPRDPEDSAAEQGNFGFHDQHLALQWVQKHIAEFNGDPSRVTIGGESAGGCSVHAQVAFQAKQRDKLFSRAIMQSGNLAVMGYCDREGMDKHWGAGLAEAGVESDTDPLASMRAMTAQQIVSNPSFNLDGYKVYLDDVFITEPLISPDGQLNHQPHGIDAVLHGDNAHEGNFFRRTAKEPGALEQLRGAATETLGRDGCARLCEIYGLSESDDLEPDELAFRLHHFPEDVRFYLPSNELQRVWPNSAFYHLTAQSPFGSSAWPGDSFHTLDLLYVFGNFDGFLVSEGLTAHLRVGQEMRRVWLGFLYGLESWKGCFDGKAVTFGIDGMNSQNFDLAREWPDCRRQRLRDLQALGVARVIQVATLLYP